MNRERIQALIKANRESKRSLDMTVFGIDHPCGTSCCVLGNYALRADLQDMFELSKTTRQELLLRDSDEPIGYVDKRVLEHFEISSRHAESLFSCMDDDCNLGSVCTTPQQAADWIELWMEAQS